MAVATKNGNGVALKILIGVATLLWAALLGFLVTVSNNQRAIQLDMAAVKVSIASIEASIAAITSSRAQEAAAERTRSAARITELEGVQRAHDRAPQ